MERDDWQYITYVKSLFLLAILVMMAWNPLSVGIASSEITQSPMNSEILQPESILSEVYSDYLMTEIDDGIWLDAVTNGVNLGVTGDDVSTSLVLPFTFDFYDASFSTIYIGSNGYLSFTDTSPVDYTNDAFPSTDADNAYCIAPFWDDLYATNDIYAWSTAEWVVIQYDTYDFLGGPQVGTFELVLCNNGTILFNYLEILNVETGTIGLNYGDGVFYNSYSDVDLLGVTDFTLKFVYEIIGSDVRAGLEVPDSVSPGVSYDINATVTNRGSNDETDVELYLYLDGAIVNSATIPLLLSGASASISYEWTPTTDGLYNFTAYVEPVPDELISGNNQMTKIVLVYGGLPYAFFRDANNLGVETTTVILSELGIPYDLLTSADMGVVDLSGYTKVIVASYQQQGFMDRVYANMSWFEDYVASGGILEFHAFPYGMWINNELPCGVSYVVQDDELLSITRPSNPMVTTPNAITDTAISSWFPTVWGHMDNLSLGTEVVIETENGDPVLIEFNYLAGSVIISTQMLEYGYYMYNCRLLENILLYNPVRYEHDVAVSLVAPTAVSPGEEVLLNVTVANTGLSDETDLQFGIRANGTEIYSDTIPVAENGNGYDYSFSWTEYVPGTYEITAYVEEVTGEIDILDNEVTELVRVRLIAGRVLWDQGHNCWPLMFYQFYIDELAEIGYNVETTTEPLNSTDLSNYSALVLGGPETSYTAEENVAIQDYIIAGGGLLAFAGNTPSVLNSITPFAGIEWLGFGTEEEVTNITEHDVTDGVNSIYFYYPAGIMNVTEPAVSLANDTSLYSLLAVSEIGLGRVVAIADPAVLYNSGGLDIILWSDNLILGINSITWLTETSYYNIITDTQRDLEVVRYMDSVVVTSNVIDTFGVDIVELVYRVDGGLWQSVIMTHVSGDEYQGTIPTQPWACCIEYVVCSSNLLGYVNVDDNDGLCYAYTVTDPVLPNVEITSLADDAVVSAIVTIAVTASDVGSGIERVEFYVDDTLVYTDYDAPYALDWDSADVADGSHELSAIAYDGAGNDADDVLSVTTDNPTTTTNTTTGTGTIPEGMVTTILVIVGGVGVVIVVIVIFLKKRE